MATSKPSVPEGKPKVSLPAALSLVGKLRGQTWGVLLGLAVTGALSLSLPTVYQKPWLELPLGMLCIAAGMLLERALNYFFGRELDSWVQHRAARFEAELELKKLVEYRSRGTINEWDARRMAALAAKRDVQGGRRPGAPRGSYKKKPPAGPAADLPAPAAPESPAQEPHRPAA